MSQAQFSKLIQLQSKGSGYLNSVAIQPLKQHQIQLQNQNQTNEDLYQDLALVLRDMKCVMKNFKTLHNKYMIQAEENNYQENANFTQNLTHHLCSLQEKEQNGQSQKRITQLHSQDLRPQQILVEHYGAQSMPVNTPASQQKIEQNLNIQKRKAHNFGKFKKTKEDNPNKPKGPLTPYFMFFQQNRDILRKRYPQMSLAEIGSLGGKIWRSLSEEQKRNYRDRYEEEMRVFKIKMRSYRSSENYFQGRVTADPNLEVTELDADEI